jgi:hypothetical protein
MFNTTLSFDLVQHFSSFHGYEACCCSKLCCIPRAFIVQNSFTIMKIEIMPHASEQNSLYFPSLFVILHFFSFQNQSSASKQQ